MDVFTLDCFNEAVHVQVGHAFGEVIVLHDVEHMQKDWTRGRGVCRIYLPREECAL